MNSTPLSSAFVIDPTHQSMESPYDNVPNDMLYCHICKKHMCDAVSFEYHLNDPVHLMRIPYIEERYHQKALIMRHEFKMAEHLKSMELNLARRKIKERQSYCTTCDLKINGPISIHRKSDFHLNMNIFLLPKKQNEEMAREENAKLAEVAEGVSKVDKDDEETKNGEKLNEPQGKEIDVVAIALKPNSEKDADETKNAIGIDETQEEEEQMFLINATSNSEEVTDETKYGDELNGTQRRDDDLVIIVSTPDSMELPYGASEPIDMFYCHLCKQHVWDSFESHIKNPTHVAVRECLEESYRPMEKHIRLQAEIAVAMGKSRHHRLNYCHICDIYFHGRIAAHRNTEGHLQLKKFFHPTCAECNVEFATRIDYDTHVLTADHLIKIAEKNAKDCEVTLQISMQFFNSVEIMKRKTEDEADDGETKNETKNGEELSHTGEEEDEAIYDSDDSILYIDEGDDIGADIAISSPQCSETCPASPV